MKKSPKPPPIPDPTEAIEAQAKANRLDTYTPFGSTVYEAIPDGDGRYKVDYEFSEPVQDLFQRTYGMLTGPTDIDNPYTQAMQEQSTKLITESFEPQIERFQEEMANRGIPEDSELWQEQYKIQIGDPMQRAYDDAAFRSIAAGDQRKLQEYNMMSNVWGRGQVAPTMPIDAMSPYATEQDALNRNYAADVQRYNAQMAATAQLGKAAVGKK